MVAVAQGQAAVRAAARGAKAVVSPQDVDALIRQFGDAARMMPSQSGSGRSLLLLLIVFGIVWGITGYRVNPQRQGVVLRFGEWVRTSPPGLHYHLLSHRDCLKTRDY